MGKPLRVLMVEDSEDDVLLAVRALKKGGYDPVFARVEDAGAMLEALRKKSWDVILCDYQMPQFNGLAAIAVLKETGIDIPLIIVSGAIGEETAVECMRLGARDYVIKGNLSRLVPAIERELKEVASRRKRRQAEEAVRKSEEKYRFLAETMVDMVWTVNMDLQTTYVSPSIFRVLGLTQEERMKQALSEIMTQKSIERVAETFILEMKRAREEGVDLYRSVTLELEYYHKDGSTIWFENVMGFIGDDQGNPIGIHGVSRNITERKRAEETLRESEEKHRILLSESPDPIFSFTSEGQYKYVNRAFAEGVGKPVEDIVGKSIWDVFPKDEADKRFTSLNQVFHTGEEKVIEARVPRADGDRYYMTTITPIKGKKGEVFSAICSSKDITGRKRAEEALRTSERRLSDIIEFFPDATLVIDKEGKIIAWNHAIEIMTSAKAADMLGKGDYEYALPFYGERRPILIDLALHPEPEEEKSYTNIERKGDILFGESFTPRLPGGNVHLSATASVLRNDKGEIVAAIECIRDNTERRKSQEDLRQAEERYRGIFENAQEGIYRSTAEGRIILANPAMARIYGYASPEELMTSVTDAAHQLYVDPEERATIRQIIEGRTPVINHETQFYRKDGSIFWGSLTTQAIRDEKGQILYYEGMLEDITDRKQGVERMRKSLGATVQAMAVTVETRDPYTAGHQRRVADLARAIATEMNLSADQIDGIRMASVIHDLGKISVPAEILSKPTKLTNIEFSLIKTHAQSGYDILKDIDFPWPIARIVLEHHERMNGSGYPNGLTGDNILMESRIIAVADVVESMASHRPYRPALGIEAALEEIEKNRGTHYDNAVSDACLRLFREKGYPLN